MAPDQDDELEALAKRWTDAGLFDPAAGNAEATLEVFAFYESVGIHAEQHAGLNDDNVIRGINERILSPGERISAADARERLGLSEDDFNDLRDASGYGADDEYTELDIASFSSFNLARDFFSDEELLYFTRSLSASMSHVADASTSLFRIDVASDMNARGATEVEFARKNFESAQLIDQLFVPMRAIFKRRLLDSVRRSDEGQIVGDRAQRSNLNMAVGFVDIVGFTPRTDSMAPNELDDFVRAFEQAAFQVVGGRGGRVVKLIGDEVMFIDADPANALAIAEELIFAFSEFDATPRAGVAYGELISRGGDYYGRVVNLAARLGAEADSAQTLTDRATADAVGDNLAFAFRPAGQRVLKGFVNEVEVVAVEPQGLESPHTNENS